MFAEDLPSGAPSARTEPGDPDRRKRGTLRAGLCVFQNPPAITLIDRAVGPSGIGTQASGWPLRVVLPGCVDGDDLLADHAHQPIRGPLPHGTYASVSYASVEMRENVRAASSRVSGSAERRQHGSW